MGIIELFKNIDGTGGNLRDVVFPGKGLFEQGI